MNLSKTAKRRRDAVEAPLWQLEGMRERMQLIRVRLNAARKVFPETGRTLAPAATMADEVLKELDDLKIALSEVWREGFEVNWKK